MNRALMLSACLALALLPACLGTAPFADDPGAGGDTDGGRGPDDPSLQGDGGDSGPPPPPVCTPTVHLGIGGIDLAKDRRDAAAASDRARVKPHGALASEYARVLGTPAPASLAAAEPTFGTVPTRWFVEQQASAMVTYTAYNVAFAACLPFTASAPEFAAAPTTAAATAVCSSLAQRFWSREPSVSELAACVQLAVTDSAAEANVRRRWSYVCASLLSASGFVAY